MIDEILKEPKKSCLKEIVSDFLKELDKLDYADRITTNRNFEGTFFVSNTDVEKIRRRATTINEIYESIEKNILSKTTLADKTMPCGEQTEQKCNRLANHINTISEENAEEILKDFLTKTQVLVSNEPDSNNKKDSLKEHSLNDRWVFNWLAKLVKKVSELLGLKTSSEKLIESSIEKVSSPRM